MASRAVTLEVATPADAPLLANLLELYVHDLSEIFTLEVGPDGRFGYPKLAGYWSQPETHFAFLIRAGRRIVGFALVTRGSPAGEDPDDLDVAEFFVLRRHRRSGIGRRAAFPLWNRIPGRWAVRVSQANRAGLPFWTATIDRYSRGAFEKTRRPGRPNDWRIFRFDSRALVRRARS